MIPRERPKTKLNEEFTRRGKGVSKIGTKKDSVVTADYSINPEKGTPEDILKCIQISFQGVIDNVLFL